MMAYRNVTVFYTSGTGNSFRAASWLTTVFAKTGAATRVVPVDAPSSAQQFQPGKQQLVGLYHPAHGLMPPWSMIKFILFQLPRGKGAHGLVVTTRGGIPLPWGVIPGGGGLSLYFPLLVLMLKGYRIRGALGLDMPCNLLNIHWGITAGNTERLLARAKMRHDRLCNAMALGHSWCSYLNLLWELLWCIPFVFYPLLPIVYLTISRVSMAKLMFADATCKHCGACARHCPREAIKMVGTSRKTPYWTWRCEACMRCMGYCRHKSIQASHLWGAAISFGLSFVSAEYLQRLIVNQWPQFIYGIGPVSEVLSLTLVFFLLIPAYFLFFQMLKIPLLQTLFTYTTFTKLYRRRYHEPNTRVRDLVKGSTTLTDPTDILSDNHE